MAFAELHTKIALSALPCYLTDRPVALSSKCTKGQIAQRKSLALTIMSTKSETGNLDEALNGPQVSARKIIGRMKFSGSGKPVPIANTPLHLSASPSELRRSAPALGEHTAEVLSELGFSPEDIESFRKMKVI